MATTQPLSPPSTHVPSLEAGGEAATAMALMASPQEQEKGGTIALTAPLSRLPVELDVSIPVRNFRVCHLLTLEPGEVIESQWAHGEDMPLAAGAVQLAWSEFEVVDSQLAVRVTRLA